MAVAAILLSILLPTFYALLITLRILPKLTHRITALEAGAKGLPKIAASTPVEDATAFQELAKRVADLELIGRLENRKQTAGRPRSFTEFRKAVEGAAFQQENA